MSVWVLLWAVVGNFLGSRVLLMWFLAGFGLGLLLGVCLGFFFYGLSWVFFWVLGFYLCGFWRVSALGCSWGFCLGIFFCGLALAVPVYILGVLRGALRFLINLSYLSKKIKGIKHISTKFSYLQ
jgi:hypothetical protein